MKNASLGTISFVVAALGGLAAAQTQSFTSPRGMESTEGGGSHGYVLGTVNAARWQQVDATLHGPGFQNIKSIAWRRDGGLATNTAFGARTLQQVSAVLAHASLGAISKDQNSNYKDTPVVVFTPKNVNTPDWSQRPTSAPAPFDLQLLFDQVWSYNGTDDLLWEVRMQGVTPAPTSVLNYPYDFQPVSGSLLQPAVGTALGRGCLATGQTANRFVLHTTLFGHGTGFRLRHSANFAPANGLVVSFLDFIDRNLSVPGLCTQVRALPTLFVTMGVASAGGSVPSNYVDFPSEPSAIGGSLYLQALAMDQGQASIPFVLSQGSRVTIPAGPSLPGVARSWSYLTPGQQTYSAVATGGIVARFEYN